MKLIPYENINYETQLESVEVINKVKRVIKPPRIIRFFSIDDSKPYEGKVYENHFKINRIISYRNSFLPIIYGTVSNENNKTKINIKIKIHVFVKVFMIIWLGGVSLAFLIGLMTAILTMKLSYFLFLTMAMLIFGYVMMTVAFKFESKKAKKFLEKLLMLKPE